MSAAPRYRSQAWREIGASRCPDRALVGSVGCAHGGHLDRGRSSERVAGGLHQPERCVSSHRLRESALRVVGVGIPSIDGRRMEILDQPCADRGRSHDWYDRGANATCRECRAVGSDNSCLPHAASCAWGDGLARWICARFAAGQAAVASLLVGQHGGRPLVTMPETSVLIIGPTRSGKTAGLVIPNLLDWDGPAIATSTKSELVDITAGQRQSVGPVHIYDPTGEIGERYGTVTWSPLAGCDDLDRAWMVASWLCASLQQGGGRGDNDWSHWAESGKLLIAPLLYVAATTGGTIVDVRTWIHGFDIATPISLLEEMLLDPGTLRRFRSDTCDVDARVDRSATGA